LESATNLASGGWAPLGSPISVPPAGNQIALSNNTAIHPQQFFRMKITR
jgi:hypothetical protein